MGIKYNDNGTIKDIKVKVGDNIPVGAEFDYDGSTIPVGYEEVDDPNKYSTSEFKTNKIWLDGKPIYQKTISMGNFPNSSNKTVNHNIANIDNITDISGTVINRDGGSNDGMTYPLPYVDPDGLNYMIRVAVNTILVVVNTKRDYSSWVGYVTIQYTKTTD